MRTKVIIAVGKCQNGTDSRTCSIDSIDMQLKPFLCNLNKKSNAIEIDAKLGFTSRLLQNRENCCKYVLYWFFVESRHDIIMVFLTSAEIPAVSKRMRLS